MSDNATERKDQRTNQWMDQWTDTPFYRDARTHKFRFQSLARNCVVRFRMSTQREKESGHHYGFTLSLTLSSLVGQIHNQGEKKRLKIIHFLNILIIYFSLNFADHA